MPKPEWSKIAPHSEPIYQTSVYDYPDLESFDDYYAGLIPKGYLYSRNGLPNSDQLARSCAKLEHAKAGLVCSTGMGALLVALLANTGKGDLILASSDLYGGTISLLRDEFPRFGIFTKFFDAGDESELAKGLESRPKLVLVETISNPKLKVCNIPKISKLSRKKGSTLLVDNTFASPFVALPLDLGADLVMHSGTKFLGGHHDLTIGVVCGDKKPIARMSQFSTRIGTTAAPFDSWLACRSLPTWKLRVEACSKNAMKLANFLEAHPKVSRVYYPGLASHPDHKIAKQIFLNDTYGGMLSFDLKQDVAKFVKALHLTKLAPSLGGVDTTISHPGKTSHRALSNEEKKKTGITDLMLRVSVGIEDYQEIESDFDQALSKIS
ncbi:MAG: trans-sulfuration enzyme family protein [Nitrososphaerales archaeon]